MTTLSLRSVSSIIPQQTLSPRSLALAAVMAACSDGTHAPLTTAESSLSSGDIDRDGVPDVSDNCPFKYNPGIDDLYGAQRDSNDNGIGDACDAAYCIDNQLDPQICQDYVVCPPDQSPLLPLRGGMAILLSPGIIQVSFPDPSAGVQAYFVMARSDDPTDTRILGSTPPENGRREVHFQDFRVQGRRIYSISAVRYGVSYFDLCFSRQPLEIISPSR